MRKTLISVMTVMTVLWLSACDMLGLGPDPKIIQREAEAKAIGGACRYGMRGIEDCYTLNKGINKAAIFDGWREMDVYMRENKIEGIKAQIAPPPPTPPKPPAVPASDAVEEIITEAPRKAAH